MKFLGLLIANLKRHRLRTVLTMLTVMVALLLYGSLCVIRAAFQQGVTLAGQERILVVNKLTFTERLPERYKEQLEKIEGVAAVCHWNWFNGIYQDDMTNFFGTFPVVPADFYKVNTEYAVPQTVREEWENTRNGAVVGKELLKKFEWKIGQTIQLTSPFYYKRDGTNTWEFKIVGAYDKGDKVIDEVSFFFRWDYLNEALKDEDQGLVGWFPVRVKNPKDSDRVAAQVDAMFANTPYETKSEPEAAFTQGFANMFGNITLILTWILSAVFFTLLIVVGNTMAQSIRERTSEIGVLKALGYTDGLILLLALAESCILALLGGLTGLLLIWLQATYMGSPSPSNFPVWFLPNNAVLLGAALCLGLGIAAGIVPAVSAMRLQTSIALRREG